MLCKLLENWKDNLVLNLPEQIKTIPLEEFLEIHHGIIASNDVVFLLLFLIKKI